MFAQIPVPVIAGTLSWGAVGSALMSCLVLPLVAYIALSLFFWLMSRVTWLLGFRGSNRIAEREASSMAARGVRDSISR
jgi:hypothetical protein